MKKTPVDRERKIASEKCVIESVPLWTTGVQSWGEDSERQCRTQTSEFSYLCSKQAGYLSTTYSGQRAAFGVINVQTPLAHPMCALSGLPQSKKATGSEWQVFPGSSLQCGEVSECWEIPAPSPKIAFQLVVPSCDLLSPCLSLSLCLDLAPLRAFLFPTPSHPPPSLGWYFAGPSPPAPWVPAVLW